MKKSFLFSSAAAILFAVLVASCSGDGSAAGEKSAASNSSLSGNKGDTTYDGENSFSYTINGRSKTVKDFMHNGDGKNYIALYRGSVKNDAEAGKIRIDITNELTSEVFKFSVANTGTTILLHYRPSLTDFTDKKVNTAVYMSPKFKNYYGDSVTLTVTGLTATQVTGTFSGKFLPDDNKTAPTEITDGRFALQFTKDANP